MARAEHHVVHNPNGGWDVKRNGAKRPSVHTGTKVDAMKLGRKISRNQNTEFIPHKLNGQFQNPDSHGHDPCPPKDRT